MQRTAYTTHTVESAHHNMLDFFGMLETLMLETMQEQSVESAVEKQLQRPLNKGTKVTKQGGNFVFVEPIVPQE